jgi:hypothetical protein
MARMSFKEAEERVQNQGQGGNGNYTNILFLKDKESAYIIPLLKDVTDVEVHSVHKVKLVSKSGKEYMVDVDCLGNNCPLCKEAQNHVGEKFPQVSKARDAVYVPIVRLYNKDKEFDPQYYVLTRSTKWYRNTYVEAASRFDMNKPLEIVRSGNGVDTTWSIYPAMKVNGKDIPEVDLNQLIDDLEIDIDSSIFGTPYSVVKGWSAEQMEHYIETGSAYIPNDSDEEDKEEDIKPRGNNKYGF